MKRRYCQYKQFKNVTELVEQHKNFEKRFRFDTPKTFVEVGAFRELYKEYKKLHTESHAKAMRLWNQNDDLAIRCRLLEIAHEKVRTLIHRAATKNDTLLSIDSEVKQILEGSMRIVNSEIG